MSDPAIHRARALLIEGNPLLRTVTAQQLRNIGFGHVAQFQRIRDARLAIEREPFDVIICNRDFEGQVNGGQELIDELRREHLLPHSTVFLMLTSQVAYHHVIEAAEASLDGILVTPFTAGTLADRLLEARNRKRELSDLLRALDQGKLEAALALALQRWQQNGSYATYCGRLAAELLLRLSRFEEANQVFESLASAKKGQLKSWCTLGRARAALTAGDLGTARRLSLEVQKSEPQNADSFELLGRIQVEQCDLAGALASYQRCAELTPGCLLRAQHAGALAFYQNEPALALKMLERSVGLGVRSKLFEPHSLVLIALLRFDRTDLSGVNSSLSQLLRFQEQAPESPRLTLLRRACEILVHWLSTSVSDGMALLREVSKIVKEEHFDLESANLLLGLWARAPLSHYEPTELEAVVDQLGMRFCVSKAISEVLAAAALRNEAAKVVLNRCQTRIASTAEAAVGEALRGNPAVAAQQLLTAGAESLNAKLLELSLATVRRHAHAIPDAEAISAQAHGLLRRYCAANTHIAGVRRTGRTPGGLQVRGRVTQATAVLSIAAAPTATPFAAE